MTMGTYSHAEAYCIMQYAADDGSGANEYIWNSRDGVTPFCVTLRTGQSARHVAWSLDIRDPFHVPQPGERVFVNLGLERARGLALETVRQWWDHPAYPMSDRFATPDIATEHLTLEYFGDGRKPDVVDAATYYELRERELAG